MPWVVSFGVNLFLSSSQNISGLDFDDDVEERRTLRGISLFDLLLIIDVEFLLIEVRDLEEVVLRRVCFGGFLPLLIGLGLTRSMVLGERKKIILCVHILCTHKYTHI